MTPILHVLPFLSGCGGMTAPSDPLVGHDPPSLSVSVPTTLDSAPTPDPTTPDPTPTTTSSAGTVSDTGPVLTPIEQLLAERAGYGALAEGGDPDLTYVVTSLDDRGAGTLCDALESDEHWTIVFDVDGPITWDEDCEVRSYKTVDGRGHAITVDGTWQIEDVHDVIVSDLALTRSIREDEEACEQAGDVITVRGDGGEDPADFTAHDLWFHHLEMYDGGDGLLDIRGGTAITISWSHFHDHKKVTLAWQTNDGGEAQGMQVTWHHNHFDHTTVRNPRFHYGEAHFVNNVVEGWWQYGASSYDGARFLSEANVYSAEPDCVGIPGFLPCEDANPCGDDGDWAVVRSEAVVSEGEGNEPGAVHSVGDLLLGGATVAVRDPGLVTLPLAPYDIAAEIADAVLASSVLTESGPRTTWVP